MKTFSSILKERSNKIIALSGISRIAIEALYMSETDGSSKFKELFSDTAKHIDDYYHNHPKITTPSYKVVAFLDGMTLIATVSEVESFFQDVICMIIARHPEKIGSYKLEFGSISSAESIDAIKDMVARKYVSDMMFKKPNDYKKEILNIISAKDDLISDSWPLFVEAKARRDIGVHNGWVANEIYRGKIKEVGLSPGLENYLTVDGDYLHSTKSACLSMMQKITDHCRETFI